MAIARPSPFDHPGLPDRLGYHSAAGSQYVGDRHAGPTPGDQPTGLEQPEVPRDHARGAARRLAEIGRGRLTAAEQDEQEFAPQGVPREGQVGRN